MGAVLIIIRMVTLKQLAYYMSIKYGLFDQIIHQGATMTVRSLSLFVTRTTMLLVNIVTVADENHVGNNLLQISKLRFGQKANLLFRL